MKLNVWLLSAMAPLAAVMVLAQDTAPAPEAPTKRATPIKKKVVLDPPVTATVKNAHVNVRGRASFTGETVGHLQKGDTVTVLEQITLNRTTQDEPAEWDQIALPAGIPAWVDAEFIDANTKTIRARRINLRGGPGENYSVLGRLEKGAAIKEIKREKGWVAIEAPTNAYAYVAAEFLEMQPAPAVVVTPPPPEPAPAPTPEPPLVNVNTPAPAAIATNEPLAAAPVAPAPSAQSDVDRELEALHRALAIPAAPGSAPASAPTPEPAPVSAPAPTPPPTSALPAPTEPVTPRIVTREGFVRRAYNIQAPTDFELRDISTGTLIDYLQPKKGQNFKIFVGTHVTVTGPEGVDARWLRTPVLQVQSVDLLP